MVNHSQSVTVSVTSCLNWEKAIAKSVNQFVYEFNGELYPHYVDERDACMPWSPLRLMANAMQVALYHGFSIMVDKSFDNGMAVAITLNGEVLAVQEGLEHSQDLVMTAICAAAAKLIGYEVTQ